MPREPRDEANWSISGVVEGVDLSNGTITFWTDEFDGLQTVAIHPGMPAWLFEEGVAFRTKIPYAQAESGVLDADHSAWGEFEPQPYADMDEAEILDRLFDTMRDPYAKRT